VEVVEERVERVDGLTFWGVFVAFSSMTEDVRKVGVAFDEVFAPRFSGNQGQQRGGVTPAPRRTSKTEDEDQKGRDKSERPNARINTTTPPTRQKVCNVAPKRKQKRKDTDKTVQ
jgi:hypothetical protein